MLKINKKCKQTARKSFSNDASLMADYETNVGVNDNSMGDCNHNNINHSSKSSSQSRRSVRNNTMTSPNPGPSKSNVRAEANMSFVSLSSLQLRQMKHLQSLKQQQQKQRQQQMQDMRSLRAKHTELQIPSVGTTSTSNRRRIETQSIPSGSRSSATERTCPPTLLAKRKRHVPKRIEQLEECNVDQSSNESNLVTRKRVYNKLIDLEILYYQSTTHRLIPRLPFQRLVREIALDLPSNEPPVGGFRFQPQALEVLQEASETYLVNLFMDSNMCASHAKRVTLRPADMILTCQLRGAQTTNWFEGTNE